MTFRQPGKIRVVTYTIVYLFIFDLKLLKPSVIVRMKNATELVNPTHFLGFAVTDKLTIEKAEFFPPKTAENIDLREVQQL